MPKKNEPPTELGAAIRHVREKVLNLSQEELGEALNVRGNVISRWETGVNQPPIPSLARLAHLAAKTEAEELRLYSEWVHLSGYPRPTTRTPAASAPAPDAGQVPRSPDGAYPETIEGQMARAVVDFIPDPELRWELVRRLREMARQWQEGAAGKAPDQDHP